MFQSLTPLPPDPILGLSIAFKADANPNKIDLGMGVYRDAYGNTPVMSAVKKAEQMILKSQSTKAYVGPVGAVDFNDTIARIVLGDALQPTRKTPHDCANTWRNWWFASDG